MTIDKKDIHTLEHVKSEADPDVEILALRSKVAALKSEITSMQRDYGNLQGYFRDLGLALRDRQIKPPSIAYKPVAGGRKVTSPCVAVLHWTDWHFGAVQQADEIEFMDSFSPEQLSARIQHLNEDFLNWIDVLRSAYTIDECVVLDTGDNISGDIHRDLSITNAFPVPVQETECALLKADALKVLVPHFKKVIVHFVTPDNHGRLTKKPQAKQAGLNTHNYTVGWMAKKLSEKLINVNFNIYTPHSKAVQVLNRNYLISHGHDVKGWAGFPYYGIERKVSREALVRLWEPDKNKFHKCVLGHWHAPLAHPWYWIGGSASGTDALDHKNGRRSKAKQVAWIVHPRKGEFNRTEFRLRDK